MMSWRRRHIAGLLRLRVFWEKVLILCFSKLEIGLCKYYSGVRNEENEMLMRRIALDFLHKKSVKDGCLCHQC